MAAVFTNVTVNGEPIYAVREIDQARGLAVGVILGDKEGYEIVRERPDVGYRYVEAQGMIEFKTVSDD